MDDAADEELGEADPLCKGRGGGHTFSGSGGRVLRRGAARRQQRGCRTTPDDELTYRGASGEIPIGIADCDRFRMWIHVVSSLASIRAG